ncbi:MAG: DUF1353 domain-containing protein [Nanoarchaeota archaeon]|nr:DUF1353 domain-containing protein [Nanoarchaeota archaeon]
MEKITYRKLRRYKYQIMEPFQYQTGLVGYGDINTKDDWVVLDNKGVLKTKKGYTWDGASGPTIDTKNFMRGALVHDALYQLMRENLLEMKHRQYADQLLREICQRDGMSRFRSWYVYIAVRSWFGKKAAQQRPVQPPMRAP